MQACVLVLLLLSALFGCEENSAPAPSGTVAVSSAAVAREHEDTNAAAVALGDATRGKALAQHFECNRCHEGTGLADMASERHCVRCHQEIEAGKVKASPAVLAKWKHNLQGVSQAPSLASLARFEPAFLERYLQEPDDLRPGLLSTMPRLKVSPEQARDLTAYLQSLGAAPKQPALALAAGDVKRGQELALQRGCGACHAFSGVEGWPPSQAGGPAGELAPDLRWARERLSSANIALWLRDPASVKPDTLMPKLGLSDDEVAHLTVFITTAKLSAVARSVPSRLPVLDRPVSFAEVDREVFSVTCRHCHSNTEAAFGDGGPGYDGGFGFTPRRVDLSSHRGVSSGMLAADGERHSLFERMPDGTPRLVATLLARQAELAGSPSPSLRGMPLGLPALTPAQIQLVESWIAQGRPL